MNLFGLKESIQSEDHIIDLKIENFSFENTASQEKTFIPKLFNGLYALSVSVYPNGSCPKYADYVSLVVKSSMTANRDLTAMGSTNSMTCTSSIIDVSGEGRYSQSFGIETIMFIDSYIPGLERFMKRSTLLSQKEDLLPEDALTMRFEFSFTSNQELAMLTKITEFLPSLFVDLSNPGASGADNSGIRDFFEIFKDTEAKSNEECSGFACAKSVDNYMSPNKLQSVQASSNGIHEIIDPGQISGFEFHKENEDVKTVVTEMHVEIEHQILDDVIHKENDSIETSEFGIQKGNTDQAADIEIINKNEANPTSGNVIHKGNEEDQTSRYETNELIKLRGGDSFFEANKNTIVGLHCKVRNIEEKVRQLRRTGDDPAKNIIIVVNGHRMFLKTNQSHKNRVDFRLTTDEELYKIFYSNVSLEDEECKSIYRMHAAVPFFSNLLDRDENALFHVEKNEQVGVPEASDGQKNSNTFSAATCGTNEIVDGGEHENFQHPSDKNVCMSSEKFRLDSTEKHIQSENFGERNKLTTTLVKNADKTEKRVRNDESSNEEENSNKHKWHFLIQTADKVTIAIPFEEHKETIGSKLLAASAVFENMLKHPMKERSERRVELKDASSRTVNNLLSYVENGKLSDIPLPEAYDLYEAADKYAVKNLMKACADFMSYFPITENGWSMVKLAELHSDMYLLKSAESVLILICRLMQTATKKKDEFMDMIRDLAKDADISLEANPAQSDFFVQDFNFYQ